MSWYYYSGPVTRPIRVSSTKSVAVRPNTKVEILEVTPDVQALLRTNKLRRCGRPQGAVSLADQPVPAPMRLRDVLAPSPLAQHFAEKGVTPSKAMPPQRKKGAPEFTVHELAAAEDAPPVAGGADPVADLADPVAEVAPNGGGKTWRKKRHNQ